MHGVVSLQSARGTAGWDVLTEQQDNSMHVDQGVRRFLLRKYLPARKQLPASKRQAYSNSLKCSEPSMS
jgi:hypothetical protein